MWETSVTYWFNSNVFNLKNKNSIFLLVNCFETSQIRMVLFMYQRCETEGKVENN